MAGTTPAPVSDFISRAEARAEIGTLVAEQVAAFEAQRQSMAALEEKAKSFIETLAQQTDAALKRNAEVTEAQITSQVGALREQTVSTVTTVEGKLTEIESLIAFHTSAQEGAATDLAAQVRSSYLACKRRP